MKTLQQIKNQVAEESGFSNFMEMFKKSDTIVLLAIMEMVAEKYADQFRQPDVIKSVCEHPIYNRQKGNQCGNCGEYLPKI